MGESERVMSGPFSAGQVSQDIRERAKRKAGGGSSGRGGGTTGQGSTQKVGNEGGEVVAKETPTVAGASTATPSGKKTTSGRKKATTTVAADGKDVKPDPADKDGDTVMTEAQQVHTEGGYVSSDSEEDDEKGVRRRNVDEMVVIDLTADEDGLQDESLGMQPVRLRRDAHKERTLGLNADNVDAGAALGNHEVGEAGAGTKSISERRKGKQRARDVEFVSESHHFNATTYSSSESETDQPIKSEPIEDEDERAGSPEPVSADNTQAKEPPSSPESKRKTKEILKKSRTASFTPAERPTYQTQEEVDEWDRHQRDLRTLSRELGPQNHAVTEAQPQGFDKRADMVYLFQFPPVLPDLQPIVVKPDPDDPPPDPDTDAMEVEPTANSKANPVTIPDTTAYRHPTLPSGIVGKMRVHASGKVTLDWGGTPLVVGMGTEATFLQDVMVIETPEVKKEDGGGMDVDGEEKKQGKAMGMGQVKGKFVVTPDWGEIMG